MASEKPTSKRRVTQQDVAEAAGVSNVTVSYVLHRAGRSRVSPDMQEKIFRIAEEMGYQPRGVTTHTIAFVVNRHDLWWGTNTALLVHADEVLREQGFRLAVVMLDRSDLASAKEMLNAKTVDGAIFTEWHDGKIRRLIATDVPWVLMAEENLGLGSDVDQITMDTVGTTARLAKYLAARGHEHICLLTGDLRYGFHQRMQRGLFQGIAEVGLPLDNATVISAGEQRREREEVRRKLLDVVHQRHAPTAVITGNWGGTMMILNQLLRAGLRVPEDVSVVSLTDSPRLQALEPEITATTAMGRQDAICAVERLIARIRNPRLKAQRVLSLGEIIERESVAQLQRKTGKS